MSNGDGGGDEDSLMVNSHNYDGNHYNDLVGCYLEYENLGNYQDRGTWNDLNVVGNDEHENGLVGCTLSTLHSIHTAVLDDDHRIEELLKDLGL